MKLALSVLFYYELITSNLDIKVKYQKVSFSYKQSRYRAYFEANSKSNLMKGHLVKNSPQLNLLISLVIWPISDLTLNLLQNKPGI